MGEQQNESDYSFEYSSVNGAIASLKYALEELKESKEKLYLHNALKSLYAAREWIIRAEGRARHD